MQEHDTTDLNRRAEAVLGIIRPARIVHTNARFIVNMYCAICGHLLIGCDQCNTQWCTRCNLDPACVIPPQPYCTDLNLALQFAEQVIKKYGNSSGSIHFWYSPTEHGEVFWLVEFQVADIAIPTNATNESLVRAVVLAVLDFAEN